MLVKKSREAEEVTGHSSFIRLLKIDFLDRNNLRIDLKKGYQKIARKSSGSPGAQSGTAAFFVSL